MLDTRVQLPAFSMYTATPIYTVDVDGEGVVLFGLMQDAVVPDPTDIVFTVPLQAKARLDLVSQAFYGVPDLWWVIARVNGLLDPLVGVTPGTQIRIPTKSRLAQEGLLSV